MTQPLQPAINVSGWDPGWSSGFRVGVDLDTSEWYLMVRRRSAATKQGLIEVWYQELPSFLGYVLRGNVDWMPAWSCYFISAEAIEVMQGKQATKIHSRLHLYVSFYMHKTFSSVFQSEEDVAKINMVTRQLLKVVMTLLRVLCEETLFAHNPSHTQIIAASSESEELSGTYCIYNIQHIVTGP